ncbi:molybdopterin-guanine dinucleotide biosynthesis protein MobA [Nocardia mangyaensis]|uniref:Molybdopterin-guanine dinucleotide biosynthesis protein MobA n=1 Tax=Nocardia mangyaensis TaxID=2213200 RepID=A0A1J0VZH9_9NOCA|nr:NTP transferase domain-containing protein [Nocardia mangyaensis]APE37467.1 molybdopterin-guanine dinucleotide biosynthesis protein MobA [Nocardia mangyaensis]
MSPIEPCAGIVLAAGAGTRYGKPKALAENGAWLRAAVTALRDGGCAPVIVMLGATGPDPANVDLPADTEWRWVADWATGLSATVRAGLRAAAEANTEYAAFLPVDLPDIGADVVARVLAAARASDSGLARAVFHSTPGHPAVMKNKHWEAISATAVGDTGGGSYLGTRQDMVCVTCDDLATGTDRDFPEVAAQ